MTEQWNIGTVNIRGINNQDKQDDIKEWHKSNNMTITSITETRTNELTNKFLKNHYKEVLIYATTDPTDINGSGTAIMINRNLNAHIHNIQEEPGRAITLTLKFEGKITLVITSIYNKANRDKRISRRIIEHLRRNNHIDNHIIMGDFNESQKKKGPILKYLEGTKNLINIATTRNLNNNLIWKSGK